MQKLSSALFNFSDKILEFARKFEKIPNKSPEIIVLVLYPILYWIFGIFHEPWFDEAQAWQIAKCASYHNILLYIPHFEGHPPLWHLLLSLFAKNNFPYEITIKSLSFLFSYIATFFIVLKSPFFRIIKILLPFTYFLFYQYAIISRPYCLVMLCFCLLAIFYKDRFKKPFKYAFVLIFLSLCHVYCFVLSSFLAFVWFVETLKSKNLKFKNIIIFILLFIFYVLLAVIIFPSKEASGINMDLKNSIYERLIYTFLIIPANCFISNVYSDLYVSRYDVCDIVVGSCVGLFFWYFVYVFTKNTKSIFFTFFVPYFVFAVVATKYFSHTHLGMIFSFILFVCWITLNTEECKIETKNSELIKKCFVLFVFFSLFSNLYWSLKSCVMDVFITYSKGKKEARFIKKYNLDKYKIMTEWVFVPEEYANPNRNGTWITVAPYFDKNIFYNFNDKHPKENYVLNKDLSKEEIEKTYSRWKTFDKPDVILGDALIEKIFPDVKTSNEYVVVFSNNTQYIQKGTLMKEEVVKISVKKELAEKLNLKKVEPDLNNYKFDLMTVTTYVFCRIFDFKDKMMKLFLEKNRG